MSVLYVGWTGGGNIINKVSDFLNGDTTIDKTAEKIPILCYGSFNLEIKIKT